MPGRPAEMLIGDSLVMVTGTTDADRFPAFLYVYVDDAERALRGERLPRALPSIEAPLDTPYGDRHAMVRDPFGNIFQIAT